MAIQNFISTVWGENLNQALNKQYVGVANCNREYEGEILEKGDTVHICGVEKVNVSDYKKNTDIHEPEAVDERCSELVINQAKYFNFQIDDVDHAQTSPKLMKLAMKNAAAALAATADTHIYTVCSTADTILSVDNVTEDNILNTLIDARMKLVANGVSDPTDIVIEVTPQIASLILKAKINLSTDNGEAMENGCLGSLGGCKIYVSPNMLISDEVDGTMSRCFVRTKRAVAFAEQLSEIEAYRPELRFADAVKGLHLYGAKLVYPEEVIGLDLLVHNASV